MVNAPAAAVPWFFTLSLTVRLLPDSVAVNALGIRSAINIGAVTLVVMVAALLSLSGSGSLPLAETVCVNEPSAAAVIVAVQVALLPMAPLGALSAQKAAIAPRCRVADLSTTGCAFLSDDGTLKAGGRLRLRLKGPNVDVELGAKIVHVSPVP